MSSILQSLRKKIAKERMSVVDVVRYGGAIFRGSVIQAWPTRLGVYILQT